VSEIEETVFVGAGLGDVEVRPYERNEKRIEKVVQQLGEQFLSLGEIALTRFCIGIIRIASIAQPFNVRDLDDCVSKCVLRL